MYRGGDKEIFIASSNLLYKSHIARDKIVEWKEKESKSKREGVVQRFSLRAVLPL